MLCTLLLLSNVRIKRKNIVRIMSSKNIDDARRLLREKRSMDSMMSFLLENNSSTKNKLLKTHVEKLRIIIAI